MWLRTARRLSAQPSGRDRQTSIRRPTLINLFCGYDTDAVDKIGMALRQDHFFLNRAPYISHSNLNPSPPNGEAPP